MKLPPLVLCLALITAALLLAVGCSPHAKKASHLERAKRHFDTGATEQARIEYLNVLKIEPTNQVAIARLAQIHFDRGELSTALPLLLRARELSPENLEVRTRLGQAYVQGGRLADARGEADAILEVDPSNADGLLILSRAVGDTNELAAVRSRLEDLRSASGDTPALMIALGNVSLRAGAGAEAERSFQRAVEMDPASGRAKLALGSLYWTQGKTNEAAGLFAAAAQGAGPVSQERLRWAQFKLQTGARAEAKEILEGAAQAEPYHTAVAIMLGELALAENNLVECSNRVTRVLRQDPAHYDALLLRGRLLRTQEQHEEALEVLRRAEDFYPVSPQFPFEIGLNHMAAGNATEAIKHLTAAVALNPQFAEAALLLADVQSVRGDAASAVTTLQNLLQARPDIPRTLLALANAYQAQGRLDDALRAVDRYVEVVTNDPSGPLNQGLILRAQEKNVEARAAFERARELAPGSEAVLYQLVELDLLEQRYDQALSRVQSALERTPQSPGATYLLARVYLAQDRVDDAEAALNRAIELNPNFSLAYSSLLEIYARREDHASALAKIDAFLAQRPGNVAALMTKGLIYDQLRDHKQSAVAYRAVLDANPDHVPALNNLAYLFSEHLNDLDQARSLAARARNLAPQDPGVADTLGWIEYRRGAYDAALPLLEDSARRLPNEAEVQYHVGMARYMAGQETGAREALSRALELSPDFNGRTNAQQYLALLSADADQPPAAQIAALEQRVAQRPDDVMAWQRLSQLYAQTAAYDQARNAYEQVLKINPRSAAALVQLATLYVGPLNDSARAAELAKRAAGLAPLEPRLLHALGRVAYQLRDYPWATSLLSDAARTQADNAEVLYDFGLAVYTQGNVAEARRAIERALELQPDLPQADAARQFVALTAVEGNPSAASQLLATAEGVLRQTPDDVPSLMVKARAHEQSADRAQALSFYDQVIGRYPAFLSAKKRTVMLLADLGSDDERAFQLAQKARETDPRDAELAKAFGKISLRRGDARYAVQLLEESARTRTTDAELQLLLGRARLALGETDAARAALDRAVSLEPQGTVAEEAKRLLAELK